MTKRIITFPELEQLAKAVATQLLAKAQAIDRANKFLYCYPVPRGGVPALLAVQAAFNSLPVVREHPGVFRLVDTKELDTADVIIDDLVDSGKTFSQLRAKVFGHPLFVALIYKGSDGWPLGEWLVWPWEGTSEGSIDDAFIRLLQFVGEDPTRQGLIDTPTRMARAWEEWTSGYKVEPASILRLFEDGAEAYDEMVHVAEISFYSHCEHHLAPFFGTVAFAYIPDKKIVGLSKMCRLVDVFARRLQVQERLTAQIIDAFVEAVKPTGAGITLRARHLCMESRGIKRIGCVTTTNRFTGVLKDDPKARAEYLSLTR